MGKTGSRLEDQLCELLMCVSVCVSVSVCLPPTPSVPCPLVDCLGINDELKNKLQDVLIPERQLTLGHMLGKGNAYKRTSADTRKHTHAQTCTQSLPISLQCSAVCPVGGRGEHQLTVCVCMHVCACAGEFGSVREALLKTEDSSIQQVAVKVLKCE